MYVLSTACFEYMTFYSSSINLSFYLVDDFERKGSGGKGWDFSQPFKTSLQPSVC